MKILRLEDGKEFVIEHDDVIDRITFSPTSFLFVLFTKSSIGVFNLEGVLLANSRNYISYKFIWVENETTFAVQGKKEIKILKINKNSIIR